MKKIIKVISRLGIGIFGILIGYGLDYQSQSLENEKNSLEIIKLEKENGKPKLNSASVKKILVITISRFNSIKI